jgi:hypothetical protein
MTTATPALSAPSEFSRVWNVVRLHMVNRQTYVGIPWIIVGGAWVVSMVIAFIINMTAGSDADKAFAGMSNSWAVISPLWYLCAVGVLAIAQSFPFALGFGVTRRDFYLGTSLLFLLSSLANGVALSTLVEVERITNGFGIGAVMFRALFFQYGTWFSNFFIFTVIQLGIFFIGACIATIYMRWRVVGMLVFWLSAVAVILVAITAISLTYSWPIIGAWLVAQGAVGLFAWALIPVAAAALTGYFILRKATPKN